MSTPTDYTSATPSSMNNEDASNVYNNKRNLDNDLLIEKPIKGENNLTNDNSAALSSSPSNILYINVDTKEINQSIEDKVSKCNISNTHNNHTYCRNLNENDYDHGSNHIEREGREVFARVNQKANIYNDFEYWHKSLTYINPIDENELSEADDLNSTTPTRLYSQQLTDSYFLKKFNLSKFFFNLIFLSNNFDLRKFNLFIIHF
jgi:hypothetical protein